MEGENDAAFHSSLYQLPPNPSLESSIPVDHRQQDSLEQQ